MRQSEAIKFYLRPDVQKELVRVSQDREVGIKLLGKGYGKRPDTLQFPKEVESLAREGASSFHISVERWTAPMQLTTEMTKQEQDKLRKAWDLVIDLDCPVWEYTKIAAKNIVRALQDHGIKNPSIKFSGGKGFHIGIPFEAFPEKVGDKNLAQMFPEAGSIILNYIKEYIADNVREEIIASEKDIKRILEKTKKNKEEFLNAKGLDIFPLLGLDLAIAAPRHFIRAPYSLHEKSGLVSLPIRADEIEEFEKEMASPEKVIEIKDWFLNPNIVEPGEASLLLMQALDRKEAKEEKKKRAIETFEGKVPKESFPPCIKQLLGGLSDGRKRSVFILINFLKNANWSWQELESEILDWNSKNSQPLKAGYLRSQLEWHKRQTAKFPPPNCDNTNYYKDIGLCKPDNICKRIKNPLNYVGRKVRKD